MAVGHHVLKRAALRISLVGLVMIGSLCASAQELVPLPPQPEGLAWPTQGWETGEMAPDVATIVQPMIDMAIAGEKAGPMGETRAVVIIHHGKLVAEAYRDGFGPDTKQVSWSMAKSVTSALTGRAVELGLIDDIDAPMPTPFDAGDKRAEITWRQWLTMTDGLDYTEIGATGMADNDVIQMMYGPGRFDVLDYIKDQVPALHEPGTVWNYSTAAFHLIGHALQGLGPDYDKLRDEQRLVVALNDGDREAVRNCERLRVLGDANLPQACKDLLKRAKVLRSDLGGDDLIKNLFVATGMDALVEYDAAGTYLGGSLVWASARDFAKFGYLYLRDGVWDGERLLPEGWVDFSRSHPEGPKENVYGAGFWLTTGGADPVPSYQQRDAPPWDSFAAEGHEGQTIFIVPSRDLVIVRLGIMSNEGENWPDLFRWNQAIAGAFPDIRAD
ncbi:serine hydrolase [Hyphomonas oceanitis]|uniref:serine hydrolase domain-containing protein n=1 Tax=Hyphomonas oceanitis TaxID=81033 RepID=UPI003001C27F